MNSAKKHTTLIFLFVIFFKTALCQTDTSFIAMTEYKDDPDAEALIISDIGSTSFILSNNTRLIFERKIKIKILKEAGIKQGEISIPLYNNLDSESEEVESFKGLTYNLENGKIVTSFVDKKEHYIEKVNQYWSQFKIALPNVKVGSIIEFSYKVSSPFLFNLQDWYFQSTIPTLYSEYKVFTNPFYEYIYIYQGNDPIETKESYTEGYSNKEAFGYSYTEKIYKFAQHNIPAYKDEEFVTSREDYLMKIDFQLAKINPIGRPEEKFMTTWKDAISDFNKDENFGFYLKRSESVAKKHLDVDSLMQLPEQLRFLKVVDHVKNNINWDGFYSKYTKKSPNKVIDSKEGNIAEINLILTGFLRALGYEAYPVLLSTRKNGKINVNYPFMHFFNYVITLVKVNDSYILLDATDKICADNRIPLKCFNDIGLIVNKDEVNWISTPSLAISNANYFITTSIDTTKLKSQSCVSATFTEYDAYSQRINFGEDSEKMSDYFYNNFDISIDTVLYVKNGYNRNKPLLLSFLTENELSIISNKMVLNPFIGLIPNENIFKQKKRFNTIDLIYESKKSFTININIPDGYKISNIPENLIIDNDDFLFQYNIQAFTGLVTINLNYHFKNRIFPANKYEELKEFYHIVMNKGNEKIVIEKK
jgi:hypothetical protein